MTDMPQKSIVFLARCTVKNAYAIASESLFQSIAMGLLLRHWSFLLDVARSESQNIIAQAHSSRTE